MFDIGFSELMVVALVALVVIGPERLPTVARTLGHLFGRLQRYVNDVKADISREIELDELRKFKNQFEEAAHSVESSVRAEMKDAESSLGDIASEFKDEEPAAPETTGALTDAAPAAPMEPAPPADPVPETAPAAAVERKTAA